MCQRVAFSCFYRIYLKQVKNTALIAISTPLDSSNFYSTLITMKDDRGESVFEVLEARAACAACIEKLDDPSKCPHVNLERPSWKSKEKQQIVKALYQGNSQVMMRESLGVVTEGSGGVFMKNCIKYLFEREVTSIDEQTQQVYVTVSKYTPCVYTNILALQIDPSGGGPSHFAIMSVIRNQGAMQVRVCLVGVGYSESYRGSLRRVQTR